MNKPSTANLIERFPPELRTASIVPRWSVVWTLTRDTVANHSYYVTVYAHMIAGVIRWRRGDPRQAELWLSMQQLALGHDLDETVTGDIVSPVKDEILDDHRYDQYVQGMMQERMPGICDMADRALATLGDALAPEAWAIVKAADRLDALLFLIGEQRMGNGVIAPRIPSAEDRLKASWFCLPVPEPKLQELWQTVMLPVIAAHRTSGGQGV